MGPAACRLWGAGNGTGVNPSRLPEPVFLKTVLETPHGAAGPASCLLPIGAGWHVPMPGSPLPCSPPVSRVCFPISFPPVIPCTTPVCIPARDRAVCRGRTGAGGGCAGSGTDQACPQGGSWAREPPLCSPAMASHPRPGTRPTSLDLTDEVTPKLPGSTRSQSYPLTPPQ